MKKPKDFIRLFFILGACSSAAGLLPGCKTYDDSHSAVQENENILLLREDVNRCKSRLETMEIEQQRILNEIQQLRAKGQDESAKVRLDELERRIAALDAARAGDRQAIIDQLSGNVAKMMGASTPKTAPIHSEASLRPEASERAERAKSKTAVASSTGYEHIVKDGETLSTIAAAYKVKPSAIIEANDLKKPDALRKGQKLFIPQ